MRKIDDFLIDRVFQSISDGLARWISCYGIAAFLLTGFFLEHTAFYIHTESWWALGVSWMWCVPLGLRAYRLDEMAAKNVIPAERILYLNHGLARIDAVMWWVVVPAEYFMACIKRPPSRKESKAPKFALDTVGLLR